MESEGSNDLNLREQHATTLKHEAAATLARVLKGHQKREHDENCHRLPIEAERRGQILRRRGKERGEGGSRRGRRSGGARQGGAEETEGWNEEDQGGRWAKERALERR